MMRKYKTYNKYKDSEVAWLGSIPMHWKKTYIKGVTKTYSQKARPDLELLSVYRDYGVIKKSSRDDNYNKPGMDLSGYKVVYPNTLVLNKMKTWSGSLGVSGYLGIVSPAYITCKIDLSQVDVKYLNYLLRCQNYVFEYNRLSYGVRTSQWDMRYQDFKSIPIYIPPPDEQTAIARFLDYKVAKINRFIRKKKQLIKLLNEQKAAIINHAVTKGLDPNAKMKDSGIEWLGEIPEHWEIRKLKSQCKIFGRIGFRGYKATDLVSQGEGAITISPSNMKEYYMQFNDCSYLSWDKYEESPEIKIINGDILFVKTGSSYGKVTLVEGLEEKATINPQIVVLKEIVCNKEFLLFAFNSMNLKTQINLNVVGGTIPTISQNTIGNYIVAKPIELHEQEQIVTYIHQETNIINTTISKIEKEIELVEEYKTALIAEAVTGKIDVRDYAIPQTETEEEAELYPEVEEELTLAAEDAAEYQTEPTE